MSEITYEFKPLSFFLTSFIITWVALWLGVIGNNYNWEISVWVFRIIAGISPLFSAIMMIALSKKAELCKDYVSRIFSFKRFKSTTLPFLFLIIPLIAVISIALSLVFGGKITQFKFNDRFTSGPFLFAIFIFIFGPLPEELGWVGYGIDGLRRKLNLITSSLVFGVFWCLWHLPLFYLKGTYQYELRGDILGIIGFFIALIPIAVITQWLYYKNNRSILSAVLFHFMVNFIGELMLMEESTKFIQAILLFVLAAYIVIKDKEFFFKKVYISNFNSLEFKID